MQVTSLFKLSLSAVCGEILVLTDACRVFPAAFPLPDAWLVECESRFVKDRDSGDDRKSK